MKTSFTVLMLLALMSCMEEKSSLNFSAPLPEVAKPGINEEQVIAFSELQSKVIAPGNCLNCHSAFNTMKGLEPFLTPGNPDKSSLFTEVENGNMPMGGDPLSTAQLEIVRNYINSFGGVGETDDSDEEVAVTFKQIQDEILTPSCVKCHSKITTEENLMKWVNQEDPLNSKFLKVVVSGSMPKGGPVLSAQKQQLIRSYLSAFLQ